MNRAERKRLKNKLAKENICYVLITCGEPTESGDMEVEMSFEGDAGLASYLVHGAQMYFDEQDNRVACGQRKILPFHG